jgi:hypothetical protein
MASHAKDLIKHYAELSAERARVANELQTRFGFDSHQLRKAAALMAPRTTSLRTFADTCARALARRANKKGKPNAPSV